MKVTVTPSSDVGKCPPTMELFQVSVMGARLAPRIVNTELATIPGWKLAAFTTPFVLMVGLAAMVAVMFHVTAMAAGVYPGVVGVIVIMPV